MINRNDMSGPNLSLCANANLRKAMRVVSQAYDAALKPSGLRGTQFTLLAVLDGHGELSLTRLAELLVLDRTTLSRNLQPLLKEKLLAIRRDTDVRVRLVAITDAGRARVAAATPAWRASQARVEAILGDDRFAGLLRDLDTLTEAARTD